MRLFLLAASLILCSEVAAENFKTLALDFTFQYYRSLCVDMTPTAKADDYNVHFSLVAKDFGNLLDVDMENVSQRIKLNEHLSVSGNRIAFYLPDWKASDTLRLCFDLDKHTTGGVTMRIAYQSQNIEQHTYIQTVER